VTNRLLEERFMRRLQNVWGSFCALPLWVQIWVSLILVPINTVPFLFLGTPTGRWAAAASVFVAATNIPIMLIAGGMSRLMAMPHLLAWGPLVVMLLLRLANPQFGGEPFTVSEYALLWAILLVNSVSLCFDALDTWRWCRGERDIPGRIPHGQL
jgi:hypothetical protein